MRRKIPELIRELFQLASAEDSKALKDKAMTFVRNGLIKAESEQIVQRKQWFITDEQGETTLFNALLLSAFFDDPKEVKAIFLKPSARMHAAETVRSIITERQSLLGIGLVKPATYRLIDNLLDQCFDLKSTKLPNPFDTLPQLAMGKNIALLQALLAQSASLDAHDSLLSAYFKRDWEEAMVQCRKLEATGAVSDDCSVLIEAVKQAYQEAAEFEELLNLFKK